MLTRLRGLRVRVQARAHTPGGRVQPNLTRSMPACFLRSRRRNLTSLRLRSAIELGASAQQPRSSTRCGDAASAAGRAAGWRRPVDRRTGSLGASWPRPGAHSRRGFGLHAASHCTRLRIIHRPSRLASVKSSESNCPPAKSQKRGGVTIHAPFARAGNCRRLHSAVNVSIRRSCS